MAQAIVGAVSKMSAMFSSMLPAPAAADAPSLALLRHNDLQYLAGHLLVLPFLFGPELKALLGSYVWLGNDALRLRGAARAAFNDVVRARAVRGARVSALDWCDGCYSPLCFSSADSVQGHVQISLTCARQGPGSSGSMRSVRSFLMLGHFSLLGCWSYRAWSRKQVAERGVSFSVLSMAIPLVNALC